MTKRFFELLSLTCPRHSWHDLFVAKLHAYRLSFNKCMMIQIMKKFQNIMTGIVAFLKEKSCLVCTFWSILWGVTTTSKDQVFISEPSTSKDQVFISEPSTSKDQVFISEPSTSKDRVFISEPSTSKDQVFFRFSCP